MAPRAAAWGTLPYVSSSLNKVDPSENKNCTRKLIIFLRLLEGSSLHSILNTSLTIILLL
ncbi:9850_t:CDS:1, partial [Ambispora leptoticha]